MVRTERNLKESCCRLLSAGVAAIADVVNGGAGEGTGNRIEHYLHQMDHRGNLIGRQLIEQLPGVLYIGAHLGPHYTMAYRMIRVHKQREERRLKAGGNHDWLPRGAAERNQAGIGPIVEDRPGGLSYKKSRGHLAACAAG
jgi:hypothetical protein